MQHVDDQSIEDLLYHPVLSGLLAYWHALRGDRAMPSRAQIAPEDIKDLLAHIILTDVQPDGRFRYRLVGTEVERLFGRSMTGEYVDALVTGDYGQNVLNLYRRVVADRRPVFSRDAVHAQSGARMISERVMLPLSNDGATVNMVLAAQTYRFGTAQPRTRQPSITMNVANQDAARIVHETLTAPK